MFCFFTNTKRNTFKDNSTQTEIQDSIKNIHILLYKNKKQKYDLYLDKTYHGNKKMVK